MVNLRQKILIVSLSLFVLVIIASLRLLMGPSSVDEPSVTAGDNTDDKVSSPQQRKQNPRRLRSSSDGSSPDSPTAPPLLRQRGKLSVAKTIFDRDVNNAKDSRGHDLRRHPAVAASPAEHNSNPLVQNVLRILSLSEKAAFSESLLPHSDCVKSAAAVECVGLDGENRDCAAAFPGKALACAAAIAGTSSCASGMPRCKSVQMPARGDETLADVGIVSSLSAVKKQQRMPIRDVERKIKGLLTSDTGERRKMVDGADLIKAASELARSSCEWQSPSDLKIASVGWRPGRELRSLLANSADGSTVQRAVDCCLVVNRSSSSSGSSSRVFDISTHHLEAPTAAGGEPLSGREQNDDIVQYINKLARPSVKDVSAPLYPAQTRSMVSKLHRIRRASFLAIENVCMVCEPKTDRSSTFLNPKRHCDATLYSFEDTSSGKIQHSSAASSLAAKSRGGRHSIFLQRESAFVYGGDVQTKRDARKEQLEREAEKNKNSDNVEVDVPLSFVQGTTFYAPPFSVSNVGHQIHDAILGLSGALLARHVLARSTSSSSAGSASGFPRTPSPFRVMLDTDFFSDASAPFYAFVVAALAQEGLGPEATRQVLNATKRGQDRFFSPVAAMQHDAVQSERDRVFVFDQRGRGEEIVCFEQLLVSGVSRSGDESKNKLFAKADVSHLIRASVFSFLSKMEHQQQRHHRAFNAPPPVSRPPLRRRIRVAVYGRNDVYRRSVDNIGALIQATKRGMDDALVQLERITKSDDVFVSPVPLLVSTFYSTPAAQIRLATSIDILVSITGAHEQPVSLFGPADLSIIEIATCQGTMTSFVRRYGMLLPEHQRLLQLQICSPMLNLAEADHTEQNVTLCGKHLGAVRSNVAAEVARIAKLRNLLV